MNWNSQEMHVVGILQVYVLKEDDYVPAEWLKSRIELADKSCPWASKESDECAPRVTVSCTKNGVITFEVIPQFGIYPRQLYAYHRYLRILAEALTRDGIEKLTQVTVSMTIRTEPITFRTPEGEEIYKRVESAVKEAL